MTLVIDVVFDWNAHLPEAMSILRGATQAAMLLYGRTSDEYRNELRVRSHGDQLFCYDDGAGSTQTTLFVDLMFSVWGRGFGPCPKKHAAEGARIPAAGSFLHRQSVDDVC